MSKSMAQNKDQGDDLQALFMANRKTVPTELDQYILQSARKAVAKTALHKQSRPRIPQWFGIAATLLVGVLVAPVLLRSPESNLQTTTLSSDSNATESLKSAPVLNSQSDVIADIELYSAPVPQFDVAPEPELVLLPETTSALRQSAPEALSIATADSEEKASSRPEPVSIRKITEDPAIYRSSAMGWIKRIRHLLAENNHTQAELEYKLFRDAYPRFEPDFTLSPK